MDEKYPLTIFYDGECPICAREIALVRRLNRREKLAFVDFADQAYDHGQTGLTPAVLGRVIHGRWADGTVITGVEVFREVWAAVGFPALARMSRIPALDRLLIAVYGWFARNRFRLTRRSHVQRADPHPAWTHKQDKNAVCCRCSGTNMPRGN